MESARAKPSRVGLDSHLTLHYRLSLADSGEAVINTFGARPATVQLGTGQLAEPLERCLLGLDEGVERSFDLEPEAAFGPRNPELVQKLSRSVLEANGEPGTEYRPGDLIELNGPNGGRVAAVLKAIDARHALLDFNHPLAGRRVRLDVRIIGVL
ncbi:MAG: FKBP-type peptidyl-prolyl cis-trans isomerase [Burkholderiales bacterium]|nr:MAG: FKBP-type peptidyl-prolyl cis-trans isomerase [Burkholderiales bacterium]